MITSSIEIQNVLNEVESQQELEEEYDQLIAYHGTSHRFRDSIEEYGLQPGSDLVSMEGQKTDQPIVYFGPEDSETEQHMDNEYVEMYSNAERYAVRSVRKGVGGRPMVMKCALPVENLVPDDCERGDLYNVETAYDSVDTWATVGYEGILSEEQILNERIMGESPRAPEENRAYKTTEHSEKWEEEFSKWDPDFEKLSSLAERFDSQIDPDAISGQGSLNRSELLRIANPKLF